jgi:hypothetical protein
MEDENMPMVSEGLNSVEGSWTTVAVAAAKGETMTTTRGQQKRGAAWREGDDKYGRVESWERVEVLSYSDPRGNLRPTSRPL